MFWDFEDRLRPVGGLSELMLPVVEILPSANHTDTHLHIQEIVVIAVWHVSSRRDNFAGLVLFELVLLYLELLTAIL